MEQNRVFVEIYISSGAKNGFYTLRRRASAGEHFTDNYIKTLSTDPDKAIAKAREYFERVGRGHDNVSFLAFADFPLDPHGTHIEPWKREQRDLLNAGKFPFGKHKGELIADADDGYIKYWAEQEITDGTSDAAEAVILQAKEIAEDRNLFEAERRREAEWKAAKAASKFIGAVGERREFTATILFKKTIERPYSQYGDTLLVKLADDDGNRITYWGWSLEGERGDKITFTATIKNHDEYDGEKSTVINRPAKVRLLADAA